MAGSTDKNLRFVVTLEDKFSGTAKQITASSTEVAGAVKKLVESMTASDSVASKGTTSAKAQARAMEQEANAATKAAQAVERKRVADEKAKAALAAKEAATRKLNASANLSDTKTKEAELQTEASLQRQLALRAKITAEQQKQAALSMNTAKVESSGSGGSGVGGTGGVDFLRLYSFGSLATQIAGLYASLRGIAFPIQEAAQFERSMAMVKAIADASDASFAKLSDSMLQIGYSSEFTAVEAASAAQAFAAAGYQVNELIGSNFNAISTTLKLAQVGMMDTAAAAEILIRTLSSFGIGIENIERVADVITVAANETNVSIQELSTSLAYVAPIAGALGMSLEEVMGPLAQMSNYGIKGSMAGTALRGTLSALINPTKEEAKLMEDLARSIGQTSIQVYDARGRFAGLAPIMRQLEQAGLSVGEAMNIFGDRAGTGFTALMKEGSDSVGQFIEKLENTKNALASAADTVGANTMGDWKQFLATINAAAISIGSTALPAVSELLKLLRDGVSVVGKFAEENKAVLSVFSSIGIGVGSLAIAIKSFTALRGLTKWLLSDLVLMARNMSGIGAAATTTAAELTTVGTASNAAAASTTTLGAVAGTATAAFTNLVALASKFALVGSWIAIASDFVRVFNAEAENGIPIWENFWEKVGKALSPENSTLFKFLDSNVIGHEINLMLQKAFAEIGGLTDLPSLKVRIQGWFDAALLQDELEKQIAELQQKISDKNIKINIEEGYNADHINPEDPEIAAWVAQAKELEKQLEAAKRAKDRFNQSDAANTIGDIEKQNQMNAFASNFSKSLKDSTAKSMQEALNVIKETTREARQAWSEAYDNAAELSKQLNNLKNAYDTAAEAAKALVSVDSENMKQSLKNMWDNVFTAPDITKAEQALRELNGQIYKSEQERVNAAASTEKQIRDLRLSAVSSTVDSMNSLLEKSSSRQLQIIEQQNTTELALIKNSGLEKEVILNKTKAQEEKHAKEVAKLASDVAQKKKQGYEEALKAAKQNLDAIYAKEKSIADSIAQLKKENDESNVSANAMTRDLKRSGMSDVSAYKDKLAEINEEISRGSDLMTTDYAAGLAVLKQAQSDAKGLASEVKNGQDVVVSQSEAIKNATQLIANAQTAINDGAAARERTLKGNLDSLKDEAAATEKVAATYEKELQKLQNNEQLTININLDLSKADKMIAELGQKSKAVISVSLDAKEAAQQEQALRKDLEGVRAKITAEVDTKTTQDMMRNVQNILGKDFQLKPVIDTNGYMVGLKYMKDGYDQFATEVLKNPIKWDASLTEAQNLEAALRNMTGIASSFKIHANGTDALNTVREISSEIESLSAEKKKLSLDVDDKDAKTRIKEIDSQIKKLEDKKATVELAVSTDPKAATKAVKDTASKVEKELPPVKLDVGVNDAPKMAIKEIADMINSDLPSKKEVELKMESGEFDKEMKAASATLEKFTKIKVDVKGTDSVEKLVAAYDQLKQALNKELSLGVKADPSKVKEMEDALTAIKDKLASLSGEELDVVDNKAPKEVEKLKDNIDDIQDQAKKGADLEVKTESAEDKIKAVNDKLEALTKKQLDVKLTVKLDADKAEKELDELSKDRSMTLTVNIKKRGDVEEYASGGPVFRRISKFIPGDGNKDDVPALLMKGEYVLKKSAVKKYGISLLNKINSGDFDIPKFASGGFVGGLRNFKYLLHPKKPISHNGVTYQLNHSTFINSVDKSVNSMSSGLGISSASSLIGLFNAAIPKMAQGGPASASGLDAMSSEAGLIQQKYAQKIRSAQNKGDIELSKLYSREATELQKLAIELERTLRQIKEDLAESLAELADTLNEAKVDKDDSFADAAEEYKDALAEIAENKADIEKDFKEKLDELAAQKVEADNQQAFINADRRQARGAGSLNVREGLNAARNRNQYMTDYENKKRALDMEKEQALAEVDKQKITAIATKKSLEVKALSDYDKAETKNANDVQKANAEAARLRGEAQQDYNDAVAETKNTTKLDAESVKTETADTIAELKIELAEALEELRKKLAEASVSNTSSASGYKASGTSVGQTFWLNSGGYIPKSAGIPGIDSVPAMLTPGEMVIKAPVVDKLGRGFMEKLNNGSLGVDNTANLGKIEFILPGGGSFPVFAKPSVAEAMKYEINKISRRMASK